jgi:hypothetical protein
VAVRAVVTFGTRSTPAGCDRGQLHGGACCRVVICSCCATLRGSRSQVRAGGPRCRQGVLTGSALGALDWRRCTNNLTSSLMPPISSTSLSGRGRWWLAAACALGILRSRPCEHQFGIWWVLGVVPNSLGVVPKAWPVYFLCRRGVAHMHTHSSRQHAWLLLTFYSAAAAVEQTGLVTLTGTAQMHAPRYMPMVKEGCRNSRTCIVRRSCCGRGNRICLPGQMRVRNMILVRAVSSCDLFTTSCYISVRR